jgi:hypothetical protein
MTLPSPRKSSPNPLKRFGSLASSARRRARRRRNPSALAGVARIVQTLFSMSARDAEQHGVDDDERHLFVRLDDAKANLGLISGRARWFRRVGVTIANGDEVGVLVPDQLEQVEADSARNDVQDLHQPS